MSHEDRNVDLVQDTACRAAQHPFAEARMSVGSHYEHMRLGGTSRFEEHGADSLVGSGQHPAFAGNAVLG